MSKPLKLSLLIVIALLLFVLISGFLLTFKAGHSKEQKIFENGSLLGMIPDGFYRGSVDFPQQFWLGKKFNRADSTGANVLQVFGMSDGGLLSLPISRVEKYPFITRIEKGVHDKNVDVLVLDYYTPENPWWLRRIRDEIVEVGPGKYLGKVHYRVIPGYPFTIGFFGLER